MSRREGVRTFTVSADRDEADRWEAIAKDQGHATVGAWLAKLAVRESQRVGKLAPKEPLVWRRGTFRAIAPDPRFAPSEVDRLVSGWIAGPFGIYREFPKPRFYVLTHIPSKTPLVAMRRNLDCREVARQLSALPGMKWSDKRRMWLDADKRSGERRRKDEEISSDVEADRERIDQLLRNTREGGETLAIEQASSILATKLLRSLIAARAKAGHSQAEVARRMGVPQPAIVRLEAGTHSPTLTTLARYASAIGVDLDVRQPA